MNIIAMKTTDVAYDGRKKELILSFFKLLHHRTKLRKKSEGYDDGILVPRNTVDLIKMLRFVDKFYVARAMMDPKALALVTKTRLEDELEVSVYRYPETPQDYVDAMMDRIHKDYEKEGKKVTVLLT